MSLCLFPVTQAWPRMCDLHPTQLQSLHMDMSALCHYQQRSGLRSAERNPSQTLLTRNGTLCMQRTLSPRRDKANPTATQPLNSPWSPGQARDTRLLAARMALRDLRACSPSASVLIGLAKIHRARPTLTNQERDFRACLQRARRWEISGSSSSSASVSPPDSVLRCEYSCSSRCACARFTCARPRPPRSVPRPPLVYTSPRRLA